MEYCPDAVPLYLHRVGNEVENVQSSGSVITIPAGSYLAIPMSAPFYGTLPGGILPPSTGDGYFSKGDAFPEKKTHRKVFVMDPQDTCHLKIESVWSLAEGGQNNSEEYTKATEAHTSKVGLPHSTGISETSTDVACSDKQSRKLTTGNRSQTAEASAKLHDACNTGTTSSSLAETNFLKEAETQTSLPSSAFQPASCTQSLTFMCCRHEFSSEELFFAHLKEVHSEGFVAGSDLEGTLPQSFTCEACGQVFSEERLYNLHDQIVKISSSQLKDILNIILEGQGVSRKASFAGEETSKKRVQPPKGSYDCYLCTAGKTKTYYLYSAFSRHLENIHKVPPLNEQGNPQCQVCVEEFPDTSALYEHIEHHHVRKATNVFNECVENVRSRKESGLEMKCVFCQRLFTKERVYFVHLKGHFVKKEITSNRKRRWKLAEVAGQQETLPTDVVNQPETLPTDSCKADEDVKTEEDSAEVKDESEKEVVSSQKIKSDTSTEPNLEKDGGKSFGEKPARGRPRKNTYMYLDSPTSKQLTTGDETETLGVDAETVLDSNDMLNPDENQSQKRKRSKTEKELGFHCCGKTFKDETGFFSHLQSSHQQFQHTEESVSDSCSVCGQDFPSLEQLLFHTNLHEALKAVGLPDKLQQPSEPLLQPVTKSEVQSPESNKPVGYFICQMCRSSTTKDPARAKSGGQSRTYNSAGQSRTYNTFWAFSFHMQKAHNVPFLNEEGRPQCQYCSESFDSEGECYGHISTAHPKFMRAPTSTFSQQVEDCLGREGDNKCVLCGREFLKRRVCQIHLKKHFSWE
ncbi:hypothetical protein Bbelb_169230 [Branchiostoma belcheri]|nr:hypothetical protein Bbelb_169230 [Branchiostoma belcheri]